MGGTFKRIYKGSKKGSYKGSIGFRVVRLVKSHPGS